MSEISKSIHTSTIPALKLELLNSLFTFSSRKVLRCRQTQIWFGCRCKVFAAKATAFYQHFIWLWRNLCVRAYVFYL